MRKRAVVAISTVAVSTGAAVLLAALTWHWTDTPHGRLDWRAALSLHLLTFDVTFQPDPEVDFEMTLRAPSIRRAAKDSRSAILPDQAPAPTEMTCPTRAPPSRSRSAT